MNMNQDKSKESKSPYQTYLEQKHAQFNTPAEIIDEVVHVAIGSLPKKRKKLILGEVNEVYAVIAEKDRK